MYLSLLRLNPRSRKAMAEAARPYELHRSLMRAFPHKKDGGPGRVLFRLDIDNDKGAMSVLVQSESKPDWAALDSAKGFFSEQPQHKAFAPTFARGQVLYFRLRANPSTKTEGKRFGILKEQEQSAWLERKGSEGGFDVVSLTIVPEGMAHDKMTDGVGSRHDLSLLSVRFEGLLRVTDPHAFLHTLGRGIGSGKGFGFGMLSVAPPKEA